MLHRSFPHIRGKPTTGRNTGDCGLQLLRIIENEPTLRGCRLDSIAIAIQKQTDRPKPKRAKNTVQHTTNNRMSGQQQQHTPNNSTGNNKNLK
mmetsp:Transcript_5303/g.11694  ORF Transcript_5303/g.11694 Transcript_5303/m.11694 type:complete len:93 (+) Transcript_5303:1355-1633(+)